MKKLFLFLLSFIPILGFAQGVYQSTGDLKQTGNYPIIWDKNVKGAPQGRATKAQMLVIPASFRDTSMTCYVIETDSTYRLQQDLVTWTAVAPGNIALALKTINKSLLAKIDTSLLGVPRGVATLDQGGKVPVSQLPASLFIYKGMYNASTNTPSLTDASGTGGYVYQVNVAGTHNFGSGNIIFNVGDYVIHNGTIWQKSAGTGYVTSVNGKQGTISLTTDDIAEGTNQYYTNSRAISSVLTSYTSSPGSISSSDNIVGAIGKLNGNIGALSSVYIQNQNIGGQTANFNINGSGTANNISLSGTDGSGSLFLPMQSAKSSAPASGMKIYNLNGLAWVTSNGFSRTLNWPSTTADHVATFIDASGTVPFLESAQTWNGTNTFGANPIVKSSTPAIILTETTNGYSSTLSKSATSDNLKLTHQLYQAGGQGSAIAFNGVNQTGTTILPTVASNPFSISIWFKTTANGTQCIFRTNQGVALTLSTVAGVLYITHNVGGATTYPGAAVGGLGTNLYNDGNWHNVIFAFPGPLAGQMYIDGIQSSTNVNITAANNSALTLGANNTANFFNGEIDQFLFYNRQLTASEATSIYNTGYGTASPVSTSLTRRWEFDEGSGTTATDVASSVVMTLTNGVTWDLNGKVSKVGSVQTGTAFSFMDGANNGELGQWVYGDISGGLILQGKSVRHSINGKFPFLQGLDGHIVLDPSISTSLPDINGSYNATSIFKLGAGTASVAPIQFSNGAYNTIPLPGSLEYNGGFSFTDATGIRATLAGLEKSQTWTGFNTFSGTINGVSGVNRGVFINSTLQVTSNNENQYILDLAGGTSSVGGSSIRSVIIANGGNGYINGTYVNVPLIGGNGTGATATVTVSSGVVNAVSLTSGAQGLGYVSTDILSISNSSIGGTGSGVSLSIVVGYIGNIIYSIRHTNGIVPATVGNVNIGSSSIYYNAIYTAQSFGNIFRALTTNMTFASTNNTTYGLMSNSSGNWSFGVSPSDNGYRVDINGTNSIIGTFRSTGITQSGLPTLITNTFSNTLNPVLNNQTLIGADFNFTFGGASALTLGVITPSNYTVTGTPTTNGTVSGGQLSTSGSGTGMTVNITISGLAVTQISVTNGGSGYAVGNTLTFVANGATIVYTVPSSGLGLSGINTLAARFSNKISLTPTILTTVPLANALENDGANLYITNSSGIRNQLAYINSPVLTGTPTTPTAAPGTNTNQIATTAFVLANSKPANYAPVYSDISGTPDLSLYATTNYVSSNFKPIGYAPSWSDVTGKPTFKTVATTGSYNDLTDIPDLSVYATTTYVGNNFKPIGYTPAWDDVTSKPAFKTVATTGSYTDLGDKPDIPNSFAWFKNKLLDNVGEVQPSISNSDSGSQLYIATNYAGGGYGEIDYFSIPGKSSSGRGHHAFYTLNPYQGTSGGIKLDFGSFGDNNAFTTGGPLAPGVVDHSPNIPQRIPVFDINTNTIYYRTPQELASDLGYALGTGYAVLNGNNSYSGDQSINGSIVATGNITTTSDQRLKKNIVDLTSVTKSLKNIRAVSFDRIDIDKHQIGLLAQNVRKYYPELVEEDKNKMLSVNYSMFIAPLLKGWQEQQTKIEALERKVKQLTEKK